MKILVCIPAFNEEGIIGDLVKETLGYADSVVVYDDGSSDNTSSEAEESGAYVIRNDKNKGKGAALKSLFKYARHFHTDIVVTMDGDGQFLPNEISKLSKPIVEGKSEIVIGYRFENKDEMPKYRKAGNKFLDKITSLASELPFRDTQSGFRAYSKKAIEVINFTTDGFGADAEILINAATKSLKISEVQVKVIYDTGRKTSTKNPISHTGEVISPLIELIALRRPLSVLGIPGLILIVIGIGFSIPLLTLFNDSGILSIPYTVISLGTFSFGTLLLLMSVVLFSISTSRKRTL